MFCFDRFSFYAELTRLALKEGAHGSVLILIAYGSCAYAKLNNDAKLEKPFGRKIVEWGNYQCDQVISTSKEIEKLIEDDCK